jgi:hypothetical protein
VSAPKITVERAEAPLAHFYQARQPWLDDAVCVGSDTDVFFDDELRDEAKAICAACPVRKECGEQALLEEEGTSEDERAGFRAYMTPQQRVSVERRGGLKGRDPMRLVLGRDGRRKILPIPEEGDRWSRHHTTLARKVVAWVVDNVEIGEALPTQGQLCKVLQCNPDPLRRVLSALVLDGTLNVKGNCGGRGANGSCRYVRRGSPRAVGWLPPHLR